MITAPTLNVLGRTDLFYRLNRKLNTHEKNDERNYHGSNVFDSAVTERMILVGGLACHFESE